VAYGRGLGGRWWYGGLPRLRVDHPRLQGLMERQSAVLRLVVARSRTREIAAALFVSQRTVRKPPVDDLPEGGRTHSIGARAPLVDDVRPISTDV
jgi:hypothetical protein